MRSQDAPTGRRSGLFVRLLLPVLLVTAVLAACDAKEGPSPGTRSSEGLDLAGRTFVGDEVTGHVLVPGTEISLAFTDTGIAADAGCNTMFGTATWADGTLRVDGDTLGATEMMCDEPLMAQDSWLGSLLSGGPPLTLEGASLTVGDATAGVTLTERNDLPLAETDWTLTTLVTGDTASSLPVGVKAGIRLLPEDATLTFAGGCNTGSAHLLVHGDWGRAGALTVTDAVMTLMACAGEVMAVESHLLDVLDGDVEYRIDGTTLTLTRGDLGLVLTADPAATP